MKVLIGFIFTMIGMVELWVTGLGWADWMVVYMAGLYLMLEATSGGTDK